MSAQIFQLVGIAFVTAVAAILVKGTKPELAVVITIAGSVILLLFILEVTRSSTLMYFSECCRLGTRPSNIETSASHRIE